MRRGSAFLALLLFVAGGSPAVSRIPSLPWPASVPEEPRDDLAAPANVGARQDTAWLGGDNGSGIAYPNGVWDFETPGSNGFQGCKSVDETANPGVYFSRVVSTDFSSHGDPCTPMILGTPGMLWCGIHQDEADLRDFIAGMGYQNGMCQMAYSPMYTDFNPATQSIDLAFDYFNHSEPDCDYAYVNIVCYDAASEVIEEYEVSRFTGVVGDHQIPAHYDEGVEVPAGSLPSATTSVQVQFWVRADIGWADEDGLWDSPCGPFAADSVSITVASTPHTYNFNDGAQGWTFDKCESVGAWMHIVHAYEYTEWLDDLGLTCGCTLENEAVGFVSTMCASGPGLVPGQLERFETAPAPRAGHPAPYWNTTVVEYDAFMNFPQSTGCVYRPGWRKYPYTTEATPTPHWSPRQGQVVWYYTSSPSCAPARVNLSTMADEPLPVEWDSAHRTLQLRNGPGRR